MKTLRSFLTLALVSLSSYAAPLDLSGEWRFALDPDDRGIRAQPADWKFPDTIRLPGMVNAQGFGEAAVDPHQVDRRRLALSGDVQGVAGRR